MNAAIEGLLSHPQPLMCCEFSECRFILPLPMSTNPCC